MTGIVFCLNFLASDSKTTFSDLLKATKAAGAELGIAHEKYRGSDCFRISVGEPNSGEVYWLDAEHGLAFRGYESATSRNSRRFVVERKVVTEIAEAAPGVWYPREAYSQVSSPDPNQPREQRILFQASKVMANDPFFDEGVFRTPIPSGYIVFDKVLGTVYRIGLDGKALERQLNEITASIQNHGPDDVNGQHADGNQADDTVHSTPQEVENDRGVERPPVRADVGSSTHAWLYGVASVVVLAALSSGVLLLKKRGARMRPMALLLVPVLVCGSSARPSFAGVAADEMARDYHFNCGVNVTFVTLKLLGYSPSIVELAKEINAGRDFSRQASMLDLKRTFEEYGLKVDALKADSASEVVQSAHTEGILIVHTNVRLDPGSVGHYIGVTIRGRRFCMIDPPKPAEWLSKQEMIAALEKSAATGHFLVIGKSPDVARVGPAIYIENTDINLGKIPVTTKNVEAIVTYRNVGSEILKIVHVGGPCTCYGGYSGTREVPPGGTGELKVVFLRERLPSGHLKRSVKIASNDPKQQVVTVYFTFFLQSLPDVNDIRLLPENIDFGRASASQIARQQTLVRLFVPRAAKYVTEEIKTTVTLSSLKVDLVGPEESDELHPLSRSCQVVTYRVSWIDPPTVAPFQGEIKFVVPTGAGKETLLIVPVRGDAI